MESAIKLAGEAGKKTGSFGTYKGLATKTWQNTSHFAGAMNTIIDNCNSCYLVTKTPTKRPLSNRNPEVESNLILFLDWVKKWSLDKGRNVRPPCFDGMYQTVFSILKIYWNIKKDFPKFELCTGLCNQDSVEHRFSQIRGRGGFCFNPTCRMLRLTVLTKYVLPLI